MLKKILSPFFNQKSKIKTPIWGLKLPETREEREDYHADLVGALLDLETLGFRFYAVTSYGRLVLVIKKAPEVTA